jgi:hypothetical protein
MIGPATAHLRWHEGVIKLDLKAGEDAVLYRGSKPDEFSVCSLPHQLEKQNAWGVRNHGP